MVTRFLSLVIVGLMAGAMLSIALSVHTLKYPFATYLDLHLGLIETFNTVMPILGLVAILLTSAAAVQGRAERKVFALLLAAVGFLIISGLITRFGNQPINTMVLTWRPEVAPENWTSLRDKWSMLHLLRTLLTFLAFCLVALASLKK